MYSKSINNLIEAFRQLPSVGQRTAERFVFHLLKSGKKEVGELTLALKDLIDNIKSCEVCWDFSDENPCRICANKNREQDIMCVVADPQDVPVIERTNAFAGLYHVLRGVIEPGDEDGLDKLKIKELFGRIKAQKNLKEIILALNPDLSGETTMLYLDKEIKKINPKIKISRPARGLPMGSDLQYADEITLGSALKNRTVK
ncbi:MAG: recombination mediator RecR [Patescibacteria group bacterium]